MTFPQTGRELLVEMLIGSTWTDITTDVYQRDYIEITRGKANESSQVAPQSCRLTVDNRAGKYSPRNPLSTYYGQIGRNTQLRVGIKRDAVYDAHSSTTGTGDLSWTHTPVGTPTGVCVFVWQYNTNVGQINSVTYGGVTMERKIFGLFLLGATNMVGYMYHLGRGIPTGAQTVLVDTTAVIGRFASATTVTGGSSTEIDTTVFGYSNATPSANPIINITTSKRSLILNALLSELDDGSTITPQVGYTALVETDLGTETASVARTTNGAINPNTYGVGWTAASAHWGIMGAAIRAVDYRFWGEVASFPPRWDVSGNDAYVPLEASGILRRLGQGTDPAESGLRNFIMSSDRLFRYWPLSGGVGTQYSLDIAPVWGHPTGYRFQSFGASFTYGEDMGSPHLGTGMALFNNTGGWMRGDAGLGYNYWAFDFIYQSLDLGDLQTYFTDYNATFWTLDLDGATGIAQVSFTDPALGPIGFSPTGVLPELLDTLPHHVRFKLLKNGADTDWVLYIDGVQVDSGTQAAYAVYGINNFQFNYDRTGTESWVNLAHLTVWADSAAELWPSALAVSQAAQGYLGEAAGTRIARIAEIAGHDLTAVGTLSDTQIMGPQYSESMLTQMQDAEATDLGVLAEPRDAFGLLYRTHRSLYNQTPKVTLQYDSGHLAPPFEPVDDDQLTRNDITAVRREGGTFRVTQDTGAMSVLAPPDGVGRYKDEVSVNVETDEQLASVGSWLLHRGTLDEARFPSITINLANPAVVAAALEAGVLAVDIGDQVLIEDAAAANIYDDIKLIALGYAERLNQFEHTWTANCGPGSTYDVAVYDTSKYDTDGSELTSGVTSSATSLSVTKTGTSLWTNDAAAFPFDIGVGGERMTVTNITSATSPQTFTVTRSVNGVVKAHLAGAEVRLWNTPRYAL